MIGRSRPLSRKPIWCSTSPSRAVQPTRNDQFCQRTFQPSTEKLGPSFCTISSGLTSSRVCGIDAAVIVARSLRDRDDIGLVDELDDPVLDQIDQRDHAFDRMGVAIVLDVLAPIGNRADQPAALLDLAIEIAGRERIDLDQFDVLRRSGPRRFIACRHPASP